MEPTPGNSPNPEPIPSPPPNIPGYRCSFLSFLTKMKNPERNVEPELEYIFSNGVHRPRFCNMNIGEDIPNRVKTWLSWRERSSTLQVFPSFQSERTQWGIDLRKVETKIIPINFDCLRKQQREMTGVRHWINSHPTYFSQLRPTFVCNRYILKNIMAVWNQSHSFTFIAERIQGTIYLRELHEATEEVEGNIRIGTVFESAVLNSPRSTAPDSTFDMNEASYGVFKGTIGDISILFTAEIDGFWINQLAWDGNIPLQRELVHILDEHIAEVKLAHRTLPTIPSVFQGRMCSNWVQNYLVGVNKILLGIMNDRRVTQLQIVGLNEIQDLLEGMEGYADTHKVETYTARLHNTLTTILGAIDEDNPSQYIVTTSQPPGQRENSTLVRKMDPLQHRFLNLRSRSR